MGPFAIFHSRRHEVSSCFLVPSSPRLLHSPPLFSPPFLLLFNACIPFFFFCSSLTFTVCFIYPVLHGPFVSFSLSIVSVKRQSGIGFFSLFLFPFFVLSVFEGGEYTQLRKMSITYHSFK